MNVFDGIVFENQEGEIVYNQWIEWDHFLVPNKPAIVRKVIRKLMAIKGHCLRCTVLDGCYLVDSNKPPQPLHPHCDCKKSFIHFNKVKKCSAADMSVEKLTNYIFNGSLYQKARKVFLICGAIRKMTRHG